MSHQAEADIEKYVLTQTKMLSDNTQERIFTRNGRNEFGLFTYNCHLCGVASLPERALQTHMTGKKHQHKLMVDFVPDADQFRTPLMPKAKTLPLIHPGEPLPPGQEEEFNVISQLEILCGKQRKSTLGLEYVIELIDNKLKEPFYICSLCDKRCDPRNIIPQITSHRHRLKYLEFHFPDVFKKLQINKKFNEDMTYREVILSTICEKIEKHFGRKKPFICEYNEYEKNKSEIHLQLTHKDHFTQQEWENCEKVLLENLDTSGIGYDDLSSDEDPSCANDRSQNSRKNTVITKQNALKRHILEYDRVKAKNTVITRQNVVKRPILAMKAKNESSSMIKKFLTPRDLQEKSKKIMEKSYILEKYKTMVDIAVNDAEKSLKQYEKNPEKHPKYSEEWKSFWSRRYKQLTLQGKNANDHDYKPEWISYWMERMKVLFAKDVEKIKIDKAKKLDLTMDEVKDIEFKPKSRSDSRSSSPVSSRHRQKRSESPIKISDDSDDEIRRKPSKRPRTESSRHSQERFKNRFSDDSAYSRQSEHRSREAYEGYYSTRMRENERSLRSQSPEFIEEGPVNLISVLRFLSALEGEVGLMAPQVLELLTEAVRVEKIKPNSADELLFVPKNANMIETVGQKLKGMLHANILDANKSTPVKRVITNIAALLHDIAKRKPSGYTQQSAQPQFEAMEDSLDPAAAARLEIAKLIVQNLMEQGRENVSSEEIEVLIDSFMTASEPEPVVVKPEPPKKVEPLPSTSSSFSKNKETGAASSGLENLSDEELQILLRNFADLTREEQSHLIAYLSKIEKNDPARVERLKKFVDLGDGEPATDAGIDIDQEVRSPPSKKSPQHVPKAELSDDEYDDEKLVKKMSASSMSESSKTKSNGNAFQDKSGLANDLMSSLMQSSIPPQPSWDMGQVSEVMQQGFYPPTDMTQYGMYNYGQMMPDMASMQMNFNQTTQWPQSAASNFYQEVQIPNEYMHQNNHDNDQFRKRNNNSHNRQQQGKKNNNNRR